MDLLLAMFGMFGMVFGMVLGYVAIRMYVKRGWFWARGYVPTREAVIPLGVLLLIIFTLLFLIFWYVRPLLV